jgi:acyl carrier protein
MKKITKDELVEFLKDHISHECSVPRHQIDLHTEFINYNMDSVKAVFIMDQLEKHLETELSPLYFWDNPTIESFSTFIVTEVLKDSKS